MSRVKENAAYMAFADRLTAFIKCHGLSVNQFSQSLGYSRSVTLNNAVKGHSAPSITLLIDIASTYPNLSLDWLIKGLGTAYGPHALIKENNVLRNCLVNNAKQLL